jgi:hypothetical protein
MKTLCPSAIILAASTYGWIIRFLDIHQKNNSLERGERVNREFLGMNRSFDELKGASCNTKASLTFRSHVVRSKRWMSGKRFRWDWDNIKSFGAIARKELGIEGEPWEWNIKTQTMIQAASVLQSRRQASAQQMKDHHYGFSSGLPAPWPDREHEIYPDKKFTGIAFWQLRNQRLLGLQLSSLAATSRQLPRKWNLTPMALRCRSKEAALVETCLWMLPQRYLPCCHPARITFFGWESGVGLIHFPREAISNACVCCPMLDGISRTRLRIMLISRSPIKTSIPRSPEFISDVVWAHVGVPVVHVI